mgnify:FL=1
MEKTFKEETFEKEGKRFEKKYGKDTAYIWEGKVIKRREEKNGKRNEKRK